MIYNLVCFELFLCQKMYKKNTKLLPYNDRSHISETSSREHFSLHVFLSHFVFQASLSKIYNCLADCQRREGLWHDAMETVVTCLILDPDHMTSLINMWFQLKKEAVKAGLNEVMTMYVV